MIEEFFKIIDNNTDTNDLTCKIVEEDNHISLTTIGDTRFNCLDNTGPVDLCGLSMSGKTYCFLDCRLQTSFFRAIPGSSFVCDKYVQEGYSNTCHFSRDIKIKKIDYYNDGILYQSFYNNSLTINTGNKEYTIHAKDTEDQYLCKINTSDNEFNYSVRTSYSYKKGKDLLLSPNTHLIVDFKNQLSLDETIQVVETIDAVMHCLTTTKTRCSKFGFYDSDGNGFTYHKVKPASEKDDYFFLEFNKTEAFGKVANILFSLTDDDKNAYFPILRYEYKSFVELEYLEYYRALEYMAKHILGNNDRKILSHFIEQYPLIVSYYYSNKDHCEIEEELRNLRNYYSHTGYIITDLRIPTDLNTLERRSVKVTKPFILNAREFVKACFYKAFYDNCSIELSENYIISCLRKF